MGKTYKTEQQLRFLFLLVIFAGSLFFLIFELIPIQTPDESLPAPDLKGHLPLSSVIRQSKLAQDLRNHSIEIKDVSQILWALQGITHGLGKRTVPSAGATYPLEIFLVHKGSTTLKKGCYNYVCQGHKLRRISSSYNQTKLLSAFLGEDYEAVSNVSTVFLILADYARTTGRYGNRGVQYVHLEVGHAIQNFLLQLTSLNLHTRVIANFTSQRIKDFLNTTIEPMVVLPIGVKGNSDSPILRLKQQTLENTEEMTVEQAIARRKSVRDYLSGKIPLSVILDILNDSVTLPYISEGNLQLDLRLVVGEIDGLLNGLYQFFLENNSLNQLLQGDLRSSLKEAGLNQIWIENAQLDIVISVNTDWIDQQPDSILYHRILMYNIGMLAQNVYLKCAAYGLGTVVVGALYEGETLQVINLPTSHTPIYIIPIGLTSEYFVEKKVFQIPLTDLARNIGLLSYIPFYLCLYLSLPMLRRRMTKRKRWIHCLFGVIPLVGVVFHFMVIHGHVRDLWGFLAIDSYFDALIRFINSLFSFPTTRYDAGMFLANLNLLLGTIAGLTGIIVAFKLVKQRKILRTIHKYTIFCIITSMILHALLNGTIFATEPLVFLLLNLMAVDLYFILYFSPDFVKTIQKKEIPYQ